MKRPRNGYTMKQYNYARHSLNTEATKKEIALRAGYSPSVATSVSKHIEKTEGYHNAVAKLASDTGNVALKVLHELQARPLEKEKTETLLKAVTVLADAFDKFTPKNKEADPTKAGNALRAIILQKAEVKDIKVKEATEQPTEEPTETKDF